MLLFPRSNRLLLRVFIPVLDFGDGALLDFDLLPHAEPLPRLFDRGGGGVVVESDGWIIHLVGTTLLGGGGRGRFLDFEAIVLLDRRDDELLARRLGEFWGRALSVRGVGLFDGGGGRGVSELTNSSNTVDDRFRGTVYWQG